MGWEFNIPWIGGSIYNGMRGQTTMGTGFYGDLYTMDKGFDIPLIRGST